MEFITAGESVDRMASYCRVEQLLFGLLGAWAADVSEPAAKLSLVATADHCAWRSRRWFEMLPTAAPGPDAFLTPTDNEREVFALVADLVRSSQGARMVLAYDELLPALRGAMVDHLERTTAMADGPVRRLLAIAITDISNDLETSIGPKEVVLALAEERTHAEQSKAALAAVTAQIRKIFGA
ncbi:MAG: hypothetical protein NT081_11100 [Actinobacteria bacterium]|nr:hypothetical protein [Actinomycetota bacterium]